METKQIIEKTEALIYGLVTEKIIKHLSISRFIRIFAPWL